MHYSEIAVAIKESDFKRKNVTLQAIHNELIKDNRFIYRDYFHQARSCDAWSEGNQKMDYNRNYTAAMFG